MTFGIIEFAGAIFSVRCDSDRPPVFLFAVRKSGSSMLNDVAEVIGEANRYFFVDVAGKLFDKGVPVSEWQSNEAISEIIRPGNLYGGFRNFPTGLAGAADFASARKLLMVRDPRDALVSEYFSTAFSHSVPATGRTRENLLAERRHALRTGVGEYVLSRAESLRQTLREYRAVLDGTWLVIRYEDIIFDKDKLIDGICDQFGWRADDQLRRDIKRSVDVRPFSERPTDFVRRVTPGDHLDKLWSGTTRELDKMFRLSLNGSGTTASHKATIPDQTSR